MSTHRFRFLAERKSAGFWHIVEEEFHHAFKVLKLSVGSEVEVTDGVGFVGFGVIDRIDRQFAIVSTAQDVAVEAPKPQISLLLGALTSTDIDDLVPALSEVGLDELCIYQPQLAAKHRMSEKTIARWHRLAVAALKQSKRERLLKIYCYTDLAAALAAHKQAHLFDCALNEGLVPLTTLKIEVSTPVAIHVAYEGGTTPEERAKLEQFASRHNYQAVSLGPNVLRARTAALVASAVLCMQRSK